MTAIAILADLRSAGIRIEARGNRLHVEGRRELLTPELRARLVEHKAVLLAFLDSPDAIRARLLALAASECLPASVVHTIPADELPLYDELDDADLLLPLHLRARCLVCALALGSPLQGSS